MIRNKVISIPLTSMLLDFFVVDDKSSLEYPLLLNRRYGCERDDIDIPNVNNFVVSAITSGSSPFKGKTIINCTIDSDSPLATLVHELTHVVDEVFYNISSPSGYDVGEMRARYMEWLFINTVEFELFDEITLDSFQLNTEQW